MHLVISLRATSISDPVYIDAKNALNSMQNVLPVEMSHIRFIEIPRLGC